MERAPLVLARAHEAVAGGCALRRPTHLHTSEDTLPGVRASTDRHRKLSNIAGVRRPSQSVHAHHHGQRQHKGQHARTRLISSAQSSAGPGISGLMSALQVR
jgi:hypothetical protein|eukprot:COSAG01_NODE_8483_length_2770_cov_2.789966_5_plen_102_part_00